MADQRDLEIVWASTGTSTPTGDLKYALGWVVEKPAYQEMNYVIEGLDNNLLALAEKGQFTWQSDISYLAGSVVLGSNGLRYTATANTTGTDPTGASTVWTLGYLFGRSTLDGLTDPQGLYIHDIYDSASATNWNGSDITVSNYNPTIFLRARSDSVVSWLVGNIQGEMAVVKQGVTTKVADGSNITLAAPNVYRMYHEGFKPTQSDVSNTVPANLNNSVVSGRFNSSWIPVVASSLNASGAQLNAGTSTILYVTPKALTDSGYSGTKANGFDVDAEVNDTRYLTSKALADSDYIRKSEIVDFVYPIGHIMERTTPVNPAVAYGGVWTALGAGRVTVGYDSNDSLFNKVWPTAGSQGGSKNIPVVNHTHPATVTDPGHRHNIDDFKLINSGSASGSALRWNRNFGPTNTRFNTTGITVATSVPVGSVSGTNQNIQPYVVVYRWERTA